MTEPQPEQRWELRVSASGFVSDSDGSIVSGEVPVEFQTITVSESEARALGLLEGNDPQ